jgi:uncharacterized membrane protein YphA (DoxX/SURF4 family)
VVAAMGDVTVRADRQIGSARLLGVGFAALRIFSGLIWLSNGLAKVFLNQNNKLDWGFISFNLINQPTARGILDGASKDTFQPLHWIYQDVVLANWNFFAWFLTVAEVAAGVSLLFGIATRLGATVGLLLIGPIWIMLLHSNVYLWEYPNELFPLLLLAIVPAGRVFGQDSKLAPRFGWHWPF